MSENVKIFIVERRHIFQAEDYTMECRNIISCIKAATAEEAAEKMYDEDINHIMKVCSTQMQSKQLELEADNSKLQFSVYQKNTCFIADMYFGYHAHEAD